MSKSIFVNLQEKSYTIEIGSGILSTVGEKITRLLPRARKAVIISDSNVAPLYAKRLQASLSQGGLTSEVIVIAAGEASKNMSVLNDVLERMGELGVTRSDVLLTLGGGVVGDLGGFAAASYMRGIAFVQVPTSLLAQIDSSVGGKVAVDLKAGKNIAGAFYQPKAVFIDTDLLATLPTRFLHDGLAEAIKYGCILDCSLFERIEMYENDDELLADIDSIVAQCCQIKANIVENDEFDTGERMLLNFGHTFGHAVERFFGYSGFTHGEGVAIGMIHITRNSEKLGITEPGTANRIAALCERFHLPTAVPVHPDELIAIMANDKKKAGHRITLIVLSALGVGKLQNVDWSEVPQYLG